MKNKISNISASQALGTGVCGVRLPDSTHTRASSDSALGINTKLQVVPENKGLQGNDLEEAQKLVELFAVQDLSCSCLTEKEHRVNKKGVSYETYVHRVNYCLKRRIDASKQVSVRYNEKREKAHYDNVQRCGSVWTCPFCARKITEGRRSEMKAAVDGWQKKGGYVYLVTLTNSHHKGDNLPDLLKGQARAKQKLWEKTKVKNMMKALGCVGRITATEVTYGDNGWHPHYHLLVFFDHQIDTGALQTFLGLEWIEACRKAKLKLPSLEHGVDVQKGKRLSDYVAKWGIEEEMTKGHVKKGKKDSLTPFDLLRQSEDNPQYHHLFKVFADAFKGKAQLHWTKGLKALLSVSNRTDEELAEETEKESIEIKEVATQIWRLILKYKIRGEYLNACKADHLDGGDRVDKLIWKYALIEADRLEQKAQIVA